MLAKKFDAAGAAAGDADRAGAAAGAIARSAGCREQKDVKVTSVNDKNFMVSP